MAKFVLEIDVDGDAFSGGFMVRETEVGRILADLSVKVIRLGVKGPFTLQDYNGNTVGSAHVTRETVTVDTYAELRAKIVNLSGKSTEIRTIWHNLHNGTYAQLTGKEWLSLRGMAQRRMLGTAGKK